MPYLTRPGEPALYYEDTGTGPAVLFAHGTGSNGFAEWRKVVPILQRQFRCIVPDLRGHARSDMPVGRLTRQGIGWDLRALALELCGDSEVHAVGFSLGADALLDEQLSTEAFASLILIAPTTGCPDVIGSGRVSEWAGFDSFLPMSLRRLHRRHGEDHWRRLLGELTTDWLERREHNGDMRPVRCPCLVILGERDAEFRRRQADAMRSASPHVTVVPMPEAGHAVHHEQPAAVLKLVSEFLATQVGAQALAPKSARSGSKPMEQAKTLARALGREASIGAP
jgi:3-oxoadipate enol-lactonase